MSDKVNAHNAVALGLYPDFEEAPFVLVASQLNWSVYIFTAEHLPSWVFRHLKAQDALRGSLIFSVRDPRPIEFWQIVRAAIRLGADISEFVDGCGNYVRSVRP